MSAEQYYKNYIESDAMLMELVEVGKKNKVQFDAKDFNKAKEYLKILVKAHLGRQVYDDNIFYRVGNDINEVYLNAMNLFGEADRISMATDLKVEGVE